MNNTNPIIKEDFIKVSQTINNPPSFINSSNSNNKLIPTEISNNDLLSNLSNLDQLSNLDFSNVNPHLKNANPLYQKNNNSSTFKKKYDNNFSDDRKNRDFKTTTTGTTITRSFNSKL